MSVTTFCYRCFRRLQHTLSLELHEMSPYLFGYMHLYGVIYSAHIKCLQPVFITIEIK